MLELTEWHGDAVSFWVESTTDLHQLAVPLHLILDGRGLHEEGVLTVASQDPLNTFVIAFGEDGRPGGLHRAPHFLVQAVVTVLENG